MTLPCTLLFVLWGSGLLPFHGCRHQSFGAAFVGSAMQRFGSYDFAVLSTLA